MAGQAKGMVGGRLGILAAVEAVGPGRGGGVPARASSGEGKGGRRERARAGQYVLRSWLSSRLNDK